MPDHCIPSRDLAEGHCPFSSNELLWPWPALLHLTSVYLVASFSRSSCTSPFPGCEAAFCPCMPLFIPMVILQFTTLPVLPMWGHLCAGALLRNPQWGVALCSMVRWGQSCKQGWQKEGGGSSLLFSDKESIYCQFSAPKSPSGLLTDLY